MRTNRSLKIIIAITLSILCSICFMSFDYNTAMAKSYKVSRPGKVKIYTKGTTKTVKWGKSRHAKYYKVMYQVGHKRTKRTGFRTTKKNSIKVNTKKNIGYVKVVARRGHKKSKARMYGHEDKTPEIYLRRFSDDTPTCPSIVHLLNKKYYYGGYPRGLRVYFGYTPGVLPDDYHSSGEKYCWYTADPGAYVDVDMPRYVRYARRYKIIVSYQLLDKADLDACCYYHEGIRYWVDSSFDGVISAKEIKCGKVRHDEDCPDEPSYVYVHLTYVDDMFNGTPMCIKNVAAKAIFYGPNGETNYYNIDIDPDYGPIEI